MSRRNRDRREARKRQMMARKVEEMNKEFAANYTDEFGEQLVVAINPYVIDDQMNAYPKIRDLVSFMELLSPQVWRDYADQGVAQAIVSLRHDFLRLVKEGNDEWDWQDMLDMLKTDDFHTYLDRRLLGK